MLNIFGRRVIGKKKFDEAQAIADVSGHKFGPRVVGHQQRLGKKADKAQVATVEDPIITAVEESKPAELKKGIAVASAQEAASVLEAEKAGKGRVSVVKAATERVEAFNEVLDAPAAAAGAAPAPADFVGASAKDMIAAVTESPELLDEALSQELDREGGPRKTVLQAVLAIEAAKDDPRTDLVANVETLLGG